MHVSVAVKSTLTCGERASAQRAERRKHNTDAEWCARQPANLHAHTISDLRARVHSCVLYLVCIPSALSRTTRIHVFSAIPSRLRPARSRHRAGFPFSIKEGKRGSGRGCTTGLSPLCDVTPVVEGARIGRGNGVWEWRR